MNNISDIIWSDSFWLPTGVSFRDFIDAPGVTYARPRDLWCVPFIGIGLYLLRLLFERIIALPIAKYHRVSDGSHRKAPRKDGNLESYYKNTSRCPTEAQYESLSKQLSTSTASLRIWFRRRRNWGRPDTQTKFCETSWRFVFYTGVFAYGITSLWQTPWFWDHSYCWIGYPHQNLEHSTYVYYVAEASFYTSLLMSVMSDVRRKDFVEQLIHHVATLLLIVFSYFANFVRVGTLVMAIHDVSDIFLEGAKCFSYLKYRNIAENLFVVFAITFIVTRIVVYPLWVIHTSAIKSLAIIGPFRSCYFFNFLLGVLQCLHIYWASIILKMAFKMIFPQPGKPLSDDRSDSEELSSEDENANQKKHR